MPESTSSQSSTPTPFNGTNGSSDGSETQWNHVQTISHDTVPNGMTLEWRELPTPNTLLMPVSSTVSSTPQASNSSNGVNGLAQQLQYNPNYMNISYQRNIVPTGYINTAVERGINRQVTPPNMIRTQNGQLIGGSNWTNARFIPHPPNWTGNKTSGGVKKQKRIRTAFTSQQMMELEQEYARTRYLDRARRIELADVLRLNERTIKIWFQNRRMKEKKDRAESLEDSEEASTSESSPEMGNIQLPIHEQYQPIPNEVYNQNGVFIESFPVSSTSSMPMCAGPMTMTPNTASVYHVPEYISDEQCHSQYGQQVHLQVQHYPSLYSNEIPMPSPESVPQAEVVSTTTAPSDIIEKSWDLSWIKSMQTEEEY